MLSVLGSYESVHKRSILTSDIDFYGRYMCTGSADGVVLVVDTHDPDYRTAVEIRSHVGPVRQATFSHPKFGFLASCGSDGKLFVHGPADRDGQPWPVVYAYDGRGSPLTSVDWAPHKTGAAIACSGADGAVSVHTLTDRRSGEWSVAIVPNAHPNGVNCVSWSSRPVDGRPLLVSGGNDGKIKIWRQRSDCTWTVVHETDVQPSAVVDVSWCPTPGFHEHVIAGCTSDGSAFVLESDDLICWTRTEIDPGEERKRNVSWSRPGNILAVTMDGYVVKFWKQVDGQKWMCLNRRIAQVQPLSERQNENTVNQSMFSTIDQQP